MVFHIRASLKPVIDELSLVKLLIYQITHVKAKAFVGVSSINPTLKRGVIKYLDQIGTLVHKIKFLEIPLMLKYLIRPCEAGKKNKELIWWN